MHTYSLQRDPRYFAYQPDAFYPDRWLAGAGAGAGSGAGEKTRGAHHPAAFVPFSYGPENCVGKNLAMLEMRMVVVLIMQRLKMRFAEGWRTEGWEESLRDHYTVSRGELLVSVEVRN